MNDSIILGFLLFTQICWIAVLTLREKSYRIDQEQWMAERAEWQRERQMLLDRIQAPTFAEFANKVIREKKLEQPPEEDEVEEPFIS